MKYKGLHRSLVHQLFYIAALLLPTSAMADDLVDAYQLAAQSNPQLSAAQANLAAFNEAYRQSQGLYYPSVSLNAKLSRSRRDTIAESGNVFWNPTRLDFDSAESYTLSLTQALYRRDYLVQRRQAGARQQQAEANYAIAKQTMLINVAQRYFDVLAAQDSLAFAQAEKQAINQQLDQTKQRFEVGLIAITGVHESHAAYDLASASEIVAQNQVAISHEILREITGELISNLSALSDAMQLISPDPADIQQWVDTALAQNYDIASAKASLKTARQQIELKQASRHPSINLVASRSYSDTDNDVYGETTINNAVIGVELNIPLYQGGIISSGVRQARHELEQAKHTLESQRRAVQRETRSAYLNVIANISQVKALKQAVTSTQSALDATTAGYDVGSRTTVDVLDSRRNLYRAQRDYARARYDYIISTLRLKQAAGMLTESDIAQINTWLL